jgi:glycosyltransferase involved in cell wall biosynthesis
MLKEISVVVTVYNKSKFLPYVIKSLINQTISHKMEYIFVDDASTDNSIQIIKNLTKHLKNVTIIKNNINCGPSIRLNQGAQKAKGNFLLLIDGDDLIFNNAAEIMLELINKYQAEFIYGKRQKLKSTIDAPNVKNINYIVSNEPLKYILTNRKLVNMAALVKTELFQKAKGCDERIFIQDESLPLRLAINANKFIDLKTAVVGIIPEEGTEEYKRLAKNSDQQYHDRFSAYYYFVTDNAKRLNNFKHLIYNRCISTWWKYTKTQQVLPYFSKYFLYYLVTRIYPRSFNLNILHTIKQQFIKLNNVKRVK